MTTFHRKKFCARITAERYRSVYFIFKKPLKNWLKLKIPAKAKEEALSVSFWSSTSTASFKRNRRELM